MNVSLARFFLRAGIAFTLLYAAVASFIEPTSWIGFFPQFVKQMGIPDAVLLRGFSAVEVVLALWLLWGKKLFIPSLASAGLLLGVAVFNLGALDIVFRDLGLAAAALALFFLKE